jgi:hypothetical protein
MRICYGQFDADGNRPERWCTYRPTQYGEMLSGRCYIYDGPTFDHELVKGYDLTWDTRVKEPEEVKDVRKGKIPQAIQTLWEARFGPLRQDPKEARRNEKRRIEAAEKKTNKKRRAIKDHPATSASTRSTTEGLDGIDRPHLPWIDNEFVAWEKEDLRSESYDDVAAPRTLETQAQIFGELEEDLKEVRKMIADSRTLRAKSRQENQQ